MTSRLRLRSFGTVAIVLLLLFYAVLSVQRSKLKPLWFDELGTMNVATQPTLGAMFRVEPADGNPPLQYLLARPCVHVFGPQATVLRLPAMCGIGCMLLCAYLFVGRRHGALAGGLTAALLLFSRLADYGVEARPYALLLGLSGLMLVLWQRAAETTTSRAGRTGTLVALGCTVFALVIASPLGFLWAGVPLASAEAYRYWRSRELDRPMLLALLAGFCGFAFTAWFGRRTQMQLSADAGHNHSAVALPTTYKFLEALTTQGMRPAFAMLLLLALAALLLRFTRGRKPASGNEWAKQDWIAAAGLALAIVPVFLFTCTVTHYFWGRYLVTGALGWFLLVGLLAGAIGRKPVSYAALLVGIFLVLYERRLMVTINASPKTAAAQDSVVPVTLERGDPTLPIVIGRPFLYPEIWWYSSPALRARLHYIADAPHAVRTANFVPELTLLAMHRAGSALFPPDELEPFLAQHKKFLLWHHASEQGCWQEDALRERRYSFAAVASDSSGNEVLYEVSAPSSAP